MSAEPVEKFSATKDEFYLFRVSIGPVQEFISEARKTRDLFMGSHLLSKATRASMTSIITNFGKDAILYPYIEDSPEFPDSTPNIYMAKIPKTELKNIVNRMECDLQDFWRDIKVKVREYLPDFNEECDRMRDKPLFYMNWVAIPINKDDSSKIYHEKVKDILRFLDERKLTRTFDSWEGDSSFKCNQCGHRECMPSELFSELRKGRRFKGNFRDNEQLCSVCLIKRILKASEIGLQEPKFGSVVDISAAITKELFLKKEIRKEVQEFNSKIQKIQKYIGNVGKLGEFFYKDYLDYGFLKKEYGIDSSNVLKELCEDAQKKLSAIYDIPGITEPSKYYTIISMDGDDMGKFMSGKFVADEFFTPEYQRNLSKILAGTASKAHKIIESKVKGHGQCIYSGGDDLLAFLPLEKSLETLSELRTSFVEEFKNFEKCPTTSAGIVISHHRDPLQKGLAKSRENIEKAKEWFEEKDAFFITVRIFSGTVITWGSKWIIDGIEVKKEDGSVMPLGPIPALYLLRRLVFYMTAELEDRLGQRFIREFMDELPFFYEYSLYDDNFACVLNTKMFKVEFKRLLERHLPKKSKLREQLIDEFELIVEVFAYMADPKRNRSIKTEYKNKVKENFENFLQICLFLSRELSREGGENDPDTY